MSGVIETDMKYLTEDDDNNYNSNENTDELLCFIYGQDQLNGLEKYDDEHIPNIRYTFDIRSTFDLPLPIILIQLV